MQFLSKQLKLVYHCQHCLFIGWLGDKAFPALQCCPHLVGFLAFA
jgi:hypothetical protein